MKTKVVFYSVVFVLIWAACSRDQATLDEWQGEILVEDGVEIVLNPGTPINPNAGRDFALEEVLRISDEDAEGANYFRFPDAKEAEDGCIFIGDEEQILKFSPDGQFLGNFFRAGQGPGEIADSNPEYFLWEDSICIFDYGNGKVLWMDQSGEHLSEEKVDVRRGAFEGLTAHWEVYSNITLPRPSPSFTAWEEAKLDIFQLSRNSIQEKKSYSFTNLGFSGSRPRIYWSNDRFSYTLDPA